MSQLWHLFPKNNPAFAHITQRRESVLRIRTCNQRFGQQLNRNIGHLPGRLLIPAMMPVQHHTHQTAGTEARGLLPGKQFLLLQQAAWPHRIVQRMPNTPQDQFAAEIAPLQHIQKGLLLKPETEKTLNI